MKGISIITPLYKGESYIESLIQMIGDCNKALQREDPDNWIEFLLINDSPQNEEGVYQKKISEWAGKTGLKRVSYFENSCNQGIHQSRINGLREAKGEFVLFLDQDDRLESEAIKELFKVWTQKQYCDMVVSNGFRCYSEQKVPIYSRKIGIKMTTWKWIYIYGTDVIFSPGQCLIRKAAIPKEWQENILYKNGCDDFYLWLLMLEKRSGICYIDKKLYYHMETNENYSNSSDKMENSYLTMCDLLKKVPYIPKQHIKILQRRLIVKKIIKSNTQFLKKINMILKNIDIIMAIIVYKLLGYH